MIWWSNALYRSFYWFWDWLTPETADTESKDLMNSIYFFDCDERK